MPDTRVRRALLFMPGDDPKKIATGAALGADCIIMDLEDGVALNRKQAARDTVYQAMTGGMIDFWRTERLVRLNPADSGLQEADIDATIRASPDGYVIPKAERADDLRALAERLSVEEDRLGIELGTIKLLAIIETALGVVNLREIAASTDRLVALMFGAEDLAGSLGAVRTPGGDEVAYARSAVVIHAAAFKLQAIDTVYVDLRNEAGLRAATQSAMELGYTGKMAIHPAQVKTIVDVFTPSELEVIKARRLIDAYRKHQAEGTGVFAFDGKMVDMPMIRAAERVMARARAAGKVP